MKEKKWLAKSSPVVPQVIPHPYHHAHPQVLPHKGLSFDRAPAHSWSCPFCALLPLSPQDICWVMRTRSACPCPTRQVCKNSSALCTIPQRGELGPSSPHPPPDNMGMNCAMLWLDACQQRAGTTASCHAAWGDPCCITQEQGTGCDSLGWGEPSAH